MIKEKITLTGWNTKPLAELCNNLDNQRIPISKEKRQQGEIPYYGATGVVDYVSDFIFNEELLLIGEDGADWSKFANSAYLIKGKSWVNNHAHVLRCVSINSIFLKEYLNFNDLNIFISGGTRGKLTKGMLEKIPINFPSIEEQKKIADILSKVDEEIQKINELIFQTEKLKNGLTVSLFTRGIGHNKYKKTKYADIPESWNILELKEICSKIGDGLHGTPKYSDETGFYFINGNNISNKKINIYSGTKNISEEEYKLHKKELTSRSILLSINGTIGNIGFYDNEKVALGKSVAYINCKDDVIKEFIAYQLESPRIISYFTKGLTGTTIKNLSLATIRSTPIFLPTIEEQLKIVEILKSIDTKISITKSLRNKLTELKKGLMSDLLTGKVRTQ